MMKNFTKHIKQENKFNFKAPTVLFTLSLIVLLFSFSEGTQKNKSDKSQSTSEISSFNLQQNYPNPFNPTTQINYAIPIESHVKLKIYNMLGNEVATLVDEVKPAGEFTVKFDASSLASGVYIYRLQTDYSVATKKLTLIK
jgi:Secretion system C-terminal sorting domain